MVDNRDVKEHETTYIILPRVQSSTKCNFKLNDTEETLLEVYGTPTDSIPTSGGRLWAFGLHQSEELEEDEDLLSLLDSDIQPITKKTSKQDGLIFHLNISDKIEKWVLFHSILTSELQLN